MMERQNFSYHLLSIAQFAFLSCRAVSRSRDGSFYPVPCSHK